MAKQLSFTSLVPARDSPAAAMITAAKTLGILRFCDLSELRWFQEKAHPGFSLNACLNSVNSLGVRCRFLADGAGREDGDVHRDTLL